MTRSKILVLVDILDASIPGGAVVEIIFEERFTVTGYQNNVGDSVFS
jgi:hypothetical protein